MIDSGYIDFEWDPHKAELNAGKHAVTFEEAAESFYDPYARIIDDPDHSDNEERFILIGMSMSARVLTVSHCVRGKDRLSASSRRGNRRRTRNASIGGAGNEGRVRFQRQPPEPLYRASAQAGDDEP